MGKSAEDKNPIAERAAAEKKAAAQKAAAEKAAAAAKTAEETAARLEKEAADKAALAGALGNDTKPAKHNSKSVVAFLATRTPDSQTSRTLSFLSLALLSLVVGYAVVRFRARQSVPALEEDLLRHQAMLAA